MYLKTDAIYVVWTPDVQLVHLKVVVLDQLILCLRVEQEACAIDGYLAVREAGTYLPFV